MKTSNRSPQATPGDHLAASLDVTGPAWLVISKGGL
jgi:hypothetical protein